jgi:[ribosomal protein S18]-alanine N-acetyltransferase
MAENPAIPAFRPMREADLDQVMRIEPLIYEHPWTRGNFEDSLKAGYSCWMLEWKEKLVGYGVLMMGVGEMHLLNLSIAIEWQRRGFGRALLHHFIRVAHECAAGRILLEVRPSNLAARALYQAQGFKVISVRRGYYPAREGREDALIMGLGL